jgi:site-specific recombinase XerD
MNPRYAAECPPILRQFLVHLETIKGYSSQTVNEYFTDLRTFFRYIKRARGLVENDVPDEEIDIADVSLPLLRSITLMDAVEFMNYAQTSRGNGRTTRARKTTSLRVFFRYLTDYTHQLDEDPMRNLERPKLKTEAEPKHLTEDQSRQLLESVDGEFAERDYCMLTLLLNCGLRRAELAGINLSDIGPDHTLLVRGKGNKERKLYLNDACWEAIEQYKKVRPMADRRDPDAFFLSRLHKRISLQGVHYVVKGYLKHIEGAQNLSTHKLRHTAATLMFQNGSDVRVLQQVLGHKNLSTTQIYTHVDLSQVQQAINANPLADERRKPAKRDADKLGDDE